MAFSNGSLLIVTLEFAMICLAGRVLLFDGRRNAKGINSLSDNELFNDPDDEDVDDDDDDDGGGGGARDDADCFFNGRAGKADFDRLRLESKALLCVSTIIFLVSFERILEGDSNCCS